MEQNNLCPSQSNLRPKIKLAMLAYVSTIALIG